MKAQIAIFGLVLLGITLLFVGLYGFMQSPYPAISVSPTPLSAQAAPAENETPVLEDTPVQTAPGVLPTVAPTLTAAPVITYTGIPEAFSPLDPIEMERITRHLNRTPKPASPFEGRVWVGFYGAPSGPGLGILGTSTATATVALVTEQALAYQSLLTDAVVIPFFHMVTTVADASPGLDGDYNHRMSPEIIQVWIDVAHMYGLVSVVDIQTAHSPVLTELEYVKPFLRQKDVHLAIDPEFMMQDGAIPGQYIGFMPVETLNIAQAWLNELADSVGERKALIIHQFDNRMFSDKELIEDYPLVDLVWDSDGFGGPGAKIGDYLQYASEPGFEYGGFKLFYNYDTPVMSPAQVLGLDPRPVFVVYQ